MIIPPKFTLTPDISKQLVAIETSKQIIDAIPIPREFEVKIRRESTLKSSLFSARIEGNPLTLRDLPYTDSQDIKKIEVFHILDALQKIIHENKKTITRSDILKLHEIVMNGLTSELGKFRTEASAIFNQAGIAVYMPPVPMQISPLIDILTEFINSSKQKNAVIRACLAHYSFEKIHPFLDGNGRVGRLILQQILHTNGYGMKGMLTIEEYLDTNRSLYYKALDVSEKDVTEYLQFMLRAIGESTEKIKNIVLEKKDFRKEDSLLPRRLEILHIVRDHKLITFDQIRRRFFAVNERTLRYDIKKLVDAGFLRKRGTTKGVYYEEKETTQPDQ